MQIMNKVICLEGKKSTEKVYFWENVKTLLEAREDVLNNFKSNVFPIKMLRKND